MKMLTVIACGLATAICLASSNQCQGPDSDGKAEGSGNTAQSCDPNEISGPLGTGEKRYVQQGEWMNYTTYFENKTNATAAAQEVFVDLPMDENLDWSTLELGEIAFGDHIDTSLSGKSHGKASYAMPGTNTFVKTEVKMKDGVLSWYMRDWDPTTADNFPASATGGFLPPNDPETHCGEGHLSYRVRVKSDAPNGAVINASAQIVFDSNPMIETDPSWWNTVATIHDVSIELDGVATNLTLVAGEPFGALPTPTEKRTGYTFDAWYTGENGTGTKATPTAIVPEGEFTLYDNWTANPYKVRFNANGGTGTMPDQSFVFDKPDALDSNAFTRLYYDFTGWATNATGEVMYADGATVSNLTYVANGVVELFAAWVRQSVSVVVGDDTVATQLEVGLPYGDRLKDPATRTGYAFGGWFTGPNGTGKRITSESIVEQGIDRLYANWVANPYKVRFNANGGTGTMPDQSFVYGKAQKLSANAFTHKMYAFVGWALSPAGAAVYADGQTVSGLAAEANSVVTLYAVWTKTQNELWPEGIGGAAPASAASEYNGYLYDEKSGAVKGTIQVKVGKPGKKDGKASVKATVVVGTKKATLKGSDKGKAEISSDGPTVIELVGGEACEITLGADGISGYYGPYLIDGSRNFFASKDKGEAADANDAISKWLGSLMVIWDDGSLSVGIATKGKVKVSGTLTSGTKVSASTVLLVGEEWCCASVAAPKANLSFVIWLSRDGKTAKVEGLGEDVMVGRAGKLADGAAFRVPTDAKLWSAIPGKVLTEYLPSHVPVTKNGAKWTLPKAGKISMKNGVIDDSKAGENPSGLKLTYKEKDGSFSGSFKVYAEQNGKLKAISVTVKGFLLEGVGYGTATVKGVGSVAVTVE